MDKDLLRNQLFEKYFEIEDGILATDLVDKLSFITDVWKELDVLCKNNIKHFGPYSTLYDAKLLEHNQKKYLILRLCSLRYAIIDIELMKNITKEQFSQDFDESFFVNNFNEVFEEGYNSFPRLYSLYKYNGNIQELLNVYYKNQDILNLSTYLYYKIEMGNAWTYFGINFANSKALLGFQTPDQFLYEQLFLNYDLTPSGMQDAIFKIGVERIKEMFIRIREIRIPKEAIPKDLYEQFLIQDNTKNHKLEKISNKNL